MRNRRLSQSGVTLIEMMIAVLISMVLSIAVMMVMSTFDGRRRTTSSTSDLDQTGALAMYQLDRWIRSAGTGLGQASSFAYGCRILAAVGGTQILPATAALPAPFDTLALSTAGEYRLAPVMILAGQTTPSVSGQPSDALVVMSTGNDASQVASRVPSGSPPTASQIPLTNVVEFSPLDLVLLADGQPAASDGSPQDCMVTQAASSFGSKTTALPLGGTGTTYYSSTIASRQIAAYSDSSVVFDLGTPTPSGGPQPPSFQVIGVGANDTLYSYDLLNLAASTPQAQADGVFEMHAVYGVDENPTAGNAITKWVDAGPSSTYAASALSNGSYTSLALIKNIRAVRIALILRTSLPEKAPVTATPSLPYFQDLAGYGLAKTRTLSGTELNYRYRVVEATIPVRNNNY